MTGTKATIDHDEIQEWAEARGAHPARVRGTGRRGDIGMIRLDFPGYSGARSLEPITWDQFFDKFDESNLALVYRESTARGGTSNFNKLVGRETVDIRRGRGVKVAMPRRRAKQAASRGGRKATGRSRQAESKRATVSSRGRAVARAGAEKAGRVISRAGREITRAGRTIARGKRTTGRASSSRRRTS